MPKVDLIFDADCPNVEAARSQLRLALARAGQAPEWEEWQRSDPAAPSYVRRYGSPTILVDGRDAAGQAAAEEANCCRLYRSESGGLQGVPSAELIAAALRGPASSDSPVPSASGGLRAWLAMIPAIGVAMLPNVACPACWPAYAGLLGSVGLGFLIKTTYLLPLTIAFLLVAVAVLGFRAGRRRGYGPFLLGLLAAVFIVAGKFLLESDAIMFGGIALLIGASLWNSWPKRIASPTCPSCVTTGSSSPD